MTFFVTKQTYLKGTKLQNVMYHVSIPRSCTKTNHVPGTIDHPENTGPQSSLLAPYTNSLIKGRIHKFAYINIS